MPLNSDTTVTVIITVHVPSEAGKGQQVHHERKEVFIDQLPEYYMGFRSRYGNWARIEFLFPRVETK